MARRVVIFDIADKRSRVIDSSLAPLRSWRRQIAQRSGFDIEIIAVPKEQRLVDIVRNSAADIALLLTDWSHAPGYVEYCAQAARDGLPPSSKLAIFDTYDPSNTPHLSVLPLVDRYLKKVMFRDLADYTREFRGGYVVTDRLSKDYGYNIGRHELGSQGSTDELKKLTLSWTFGASPLYRRLLRFGLLLSKPLATRPIDVSCRMGVAADQLALTGEALKQMNWYRRHRLEALRKIHEAGTSLRLSSAERCNHRQYILELYKTKIVVSPFGYGELCYRDYEAVCCGVLLMKPEVGHLRAKPDIFVPGQTYVPLKWDFSDLPEKIRHYLKHPDEAAAIAKRATDVMRDYFKHLRVADNVKDALHGL